MRAVVERRQACALQKGARRVARCGGGYPAFAGVPLPSFFFFFVARMERSVIRGGRAAGYFVPGFRCAPSGLRNQEWKIERRAPPLTFLFFRTGFAFDVTVFLLARDQLAIAHDENSGAKERREARALGHDRHRQEATPFCVALNRPTAGRGPWP